MLGSSIFVLYLPFNDISDLLDNSRVHSECVSEFSLEEGETEPGFKSIHLVRSLLIILYFKYNSSLI